MTNVVEYGSVNQLRELRPAWDSLLAQTPHATFFQSLDWLEAQWRHVGARRKLRVFVTWQHGQPTGILPLNVRFGKLHFASPATLAFPFDDWGSFYGPIGPHPPATLTTVLNHLRSAARAYDAIDLSPFRALDGQPWFANDKCFTPSGCATLIDLNTNWQDYWESRRKDQNRRRNVERCERRLSERGTLTYVRHRPAGLGHSDGLPRWDLYDACEQLAQKSWQSGLRDGNTLSHPHVRDFLRDAHVAAANTGALDLNLLYLNDRPIAFLYGYHCRGYVDLIRAGFDPEFATLAPGNALWTRVIRDSYARGDHTIDLGPTCLDYKRFWMTRVEPTYRYRAYSCHPKSQLLRLASWLRSRFARPHAETNEVAKREVAKQRAASLGSASRKSAHKTRSKHRDDEDRRVEQSL